MEAKKSYSQRLTESRVGVPQERGLFHMLHRYILSLTIYPCVFLFWLSPKIEIVLQEIYSLFGRIAVRCKGPNYFAVIHAYSDCSPIQRQFWSSYSQARSACIREMVSNHPWATPVDVQAFLESWDMGEKWACEMLDRNSKSCSTEMVANDLDVSREDYTSKISNRDMMVAK